MFKRLLDMSLERGQSVFLWGARQTGKSTYLAAHYPDSRYINLLESDVFLSLSKSPHLLREQVLSFSDELLKHHIIIDEVQKVPELLDEIHWLIENTDAAFILCGSSARKLKQSGANLLGGRAWRYHFLPLVTKEIPDFDLLQALNTGLLPAHYLSKNPQKSLQAYIEDYLTQEIKAEGLVRNLPSFARFLDSMSFCNGEVIKYTNIARDCGIDSKTVQNYFEILVDTLLGYYLLPYKKRVSRAIMTEAPKFYLFDVGVANYLSNKTINILKGSDAGKSFEHFIFMELMAYKLLNDKRFKVTYWRTRSDLEVDFILGDADVAIEVKISTQVEKQALKGLLAFCEEHQPRKAIVVSQDVSARKMIINAETAIDIMSWQDFLKALWAGELI
jgi:uncharacterized protein